MNATPSMYDPIEMLAAYGRGTLDLDTLVTALHSRAPITSSRSVDPAARWFQAADLHTTDRPTVPDLLATAVGTGSITKAQQRQIYARWIATT